MNFKDIPQEDVLNFLQINNIQYDHTNVYNLAISHLNDDDIIYNKCLLILSYYKHLNFLPYDQILNVYKTIDKSSGLVKLINVYAHDTEVKQLEFCNLIVKIFRGIYGCYFITSTGLVYYKNQ